MKENFVCEQSVRVGTIHFCQPEVEKCQEGIFQHAVTAIERFGEEKHPRYIPPREDFDAVYAVASNPQDKLMLLAFLHTAARRSEILNLKWDDLDFKLNTVTLWPRKRKGGSCEGDKIEMSTDLAEALKRHRHNSTGQFVFTLPNGQSYKYRIHWLKQLCQRAGVKRFTFHAIRHLAASSIAQPGHSVPTVQAILRHKSSSTTARYLHSLIGVKGVLDDVFGKGKV